MVGGWVGKAYLVYVGGREGGREGGEEEGFGRGKPSFLDEEDDFLHTPSLRRPGGDSLPPTFLVLDSGPVFGFEGQEGVGLWVGGWMRSVDR